MSEVREREPTIFVQFAGQGVKYMDDLRNLYTRYPAVRPFIQDAAREIQRQAAHYDDTHTGFFSDGLDVERWILQPEETPELAYLLSSPISHPFIYLTQIANYISLVQEGMDQERLLRHTHSTTGFSTGIVASILFALGLPLEQLWNLAIRVQAMFLWQGIRCQESMLRFGVNPKLRTELLNSSEGSPSCMATVKNILRKQIEEAIKAFSDHGTVHLAYELLPGRWNVAGLPDHLAAFSRFLKDRAGKAEFRFVPSTIAAHSPFLSYALETSPLDAEQIGVRLQGRDMKIPVWSNNSGADLRNSENVIQDLMHAYFVCPATWRKQIAPLVPPTKIQYVLDFGPGGGVASLTEQHVARSNIQVINCSVPLGRRRLFEEVLPALD